MMLILRVALVAFHTLVGLAAIGAGQALVFDPTGGILTFKVAWLNGSPFPDYRFPGLFLAAVIGGTQLASAIALANRRRLGPILSLASGVLLVTWLAIQWAIIGYQHPTQLMWAILFPTLVLMAALNVRRNPLPRTMRTQVAQAASTVRPTLAIAVAIVAATTALYLTLLHPWLMSWGATAEERQM